MWRGGVGSGGGKGVGRWGRGLGVGGGRGAIKLSTLISARLLNRTADLGIDVFLLMQYNL